MEVDIRRARELYFMYLGNKFQMMRDGVSEEYYEYNISEKQEEKWMNELFESKLNDLNINDASLLSPLLLILRFNPQMINRNLQKLIDFVVFNENKVDNNIKFLIFLQKIIEIIDYYLDSNEDISRSFLRKEKLKLQKLREKYL